MGELKALSKSTTLVIAGVLFSTGLDIVSRLAMTNSITQADYGAVSIGLKLLQITLVISLVGINVGLPPMLASSKMDDEPRVLIGSALAIAIVTSAASTVSLLVLSDTLGYVYNSTDLGNVIRILAWAVVPLVLVKTTTGILRGLQKYRAKVVVEDVVLGSSRLSLILVVLVLMAGTTGIAWAVVIASLATSSIYILYLVLSNPDGFEFRISSTRRILTFSLPLLGKGLANELTISIGLLLLGVLAAPTVVGVFSATVTIAQSTQIILLAFTYLYSPIAAQILSKGEYRKAKELYQTVTKWSSIFTFPFFAIIIIYPQSILALFGSSYVTGDASLRILGFAYFIHAVLGLSGTTVTSYGKPTVVAMAWGAGMSIASVVAFICIPIWSAAGAALGTVAGLLVVNLINVGFIWRETGIHPFSKIHLRSIIGASLLCGVVGIACPEPQGGFSVIWLPVIFMALIGVVLAGVLLARGFSHDDIVWLDLVEETTRMKTERFRAILLRLFRKDT